MPTETLNQTAQVVAQEIPTWFVCVMGISIVFIGLICLIVLIKILSKVTSLIGSKEAPAAAAPAPVAAAPANAIPNRGELVAAISCALAEELGTDVRAIRILSIKKVG